MDDDLRECSEHLLDKLEDIAHRSRSRRTELIQVHLQTLRRACAEMGEKSVELNDDSPTKEQTEFCIASVRNAILSAVPQPNLSEA